jgi:hypothetical protein
MDMVGYRVNNDNEQQQCNKNNSSNQPNPVVLRGRQLDSTIHTFNVIENTDIPHESRNNLKAAMISR